MTAPQIQEKQLLYPPTAIGLSAAVAYVAGILKIAMGLIGFALTAEEKEKRDSFTSHARQHLTAIAEGAYVATLLVSHTIGRGIAFVKKVEARVNEFLNTAPGRFQQKIVEIREVHTGTLMAAMPKIEEQLDGFQTALAVDGDVSEGRLEILERKAAAYNALRQLLTNVESDARTARYQADKAREREERILPATESALQSLDELDSITAISA